MPKSTDVRAPQHKTALEASQSWESVVRFLIVRMADAAPSALLVWLAYARH